MDERVITDSLAHRPAMSKARIVARIVPIGERPDQEAQEVDKPASDFRSLITRDFLLKFVTANLPELVESVVAEVHGEPSLQQR